MTCQNEIRPAEAFPCPYCETWITPPATCCCGRTHHQTAICPACHNQFYTGVTRGQATLVQMAPGASVFARPLLEAAP